MFSCGFFNSVSGDRKYDAMSFGTLFDGIIADGVFNTTLNKFNVTPGTGLEVLVDTGKAWFNHTWNKNDNIMNLTIESPDVYWDRIDAVILEVDQRDQTRNNQIRILKGVAATEPQKPSMDTQVPNLWYHPLAWVTVKASASDIKSENIEIAVGKSECPFVTGLVQQATLDNLWSNWEAEWSNWKSEEKQEFDDWWANIKSVLNDDTVGKLQKQIEERVKISDKASAEDMASGADGKWVTPKMLKDNKMNVEVGDIVHSAWDLETSTNGEYVAVDGRTFDPVALFGSEENVPDRWKGTVGILGDGLVATINRLYFAETRLGQTFYYRNNDYTMFYGGAIDKGYICVWGVEYRTSATNSKNNKGKSGVVTFSIDDFRKLCLGKYTQETIPLHYKSTVMFDGVDHVESDGYNGLFYCGKTLCAHSDLVSSYGGFAHYLTTLDLSRTSNVEAVIDSYYNGGYMIWYAVNDTLYSISKGKADSDNVYLHIATNLSERPITNISKICNASEAPPSDPYVSSYTIIPATEALIHYKNGRMSPVSSPEVSPKVISLSGNPSELKINDYLKSSAFYYGKNVLARRSVNIGNKLYYSFYNSGKQIIAVLDYNAGTLKHLSSIPDYNDGDGRHTILLKKENYLYRLRISTAFTSDGYGEGLYIDRLKLEDDTIEIDYKILKNQFYSDRYGMWFTVEGLDVKRPVINDNLYYVRVFALSPAGNRYNYSGVLYFDGVTIQAYMYAYLANKEVSLGTGVSDGYILNDDGAKNQTCSVILNTIDPTKKALEPEEAYAFTKVKKQV